MFGLGIHTAQWTNLACDTKCSKSKSALCVHIPRVSTRPIEMGLTRTAWVKLNCLRASVGRFDLSMHKWGLASSVKCECGTSEQIADHIIVTCPTYWATQGIMGLTLLNDKTPSLPTSDLGNTEGWDHKRLNSQSPSFLFV